ncbi:unnamed protein product [Amoebophrya sp. A25]|nr:unnamed protein product [Amoebophrya sp. A25]|eukprot:GSA25T00021511001.1
MFVSLAFLLGYELAVRQRGEAGEEDRSDVPLERERSTTTSRRSSKMVATPRRGRPPFQQELDSVLPSQEDGGDEEEFSPFAHRELLRAYLAFRVLCLPSDAQGILASLVFQTSGGSRSPSPVDHAGNYKGISSAMSSKNSTTSNVSQRSTSSSILLLPSSRDLLARVLVKWQPEFASAGATTFRMASSALLEPMRVAGLPLDKPDASLAVLQAREAEFRSGVWLEDLKRETARIAALREYISSALQEVGTRPAEEIDEAGQSESSWVTIDALEDRKILYRIEDRGDFDAAHAFAVEKAGGDSPNARRNTSTASSMSPGKKSQIMSKSKVLHTVMDLTIPGLDFFSLTALLKEADMHVDWMPRVFGYGVRTSAVLEKPRFNEAVGYWVLALPFLVERDFLAKLSVYHEAPKSGMHATTPTSPGVAGATLPPFEQIVLVDSCGLNDLADPVDAVGKFPHLLSEFNAPVIEAISGAVDLDELEKGANSDEANSNMPGSRAVSKNLDGARQGGKGSSEGNGKTKIGSVGKNPQQHAPAEIEQDPSKREVFIRVPDGKYIAPRPMFGKGGAGASSSCVLGGLMPGGEYGAEDEESDRQSLAYVDPNEREIVGMPQLGPTTPDDYNLLGMWDNIGRSPVVRSKKSPKPQVRPSIRPDIVAPRGSDFSQKLVVGEARAATSLVLEKIASRRSRASIAGDSRMSSKVMSNDGATSSSMAGRGRGGSALQSGEEQIVSLSEYLSRKSRMRQSGVPVVSGKVVVKKPEPEPAMAMEDFLANIDDAHIDEGMDHDEGRDIMVGPHSPENNFAARFMSSSISAPNHMNSKGEGETISSANDFREADLGFDSSPDLITPATSSFTGEKSSSGGQLSASRYSSSAAASTAGTQPPGHVANRNVVPRWTEGSHRSVLPASPSASTGGRNSSPSQSKTTTGPNYAQQRSSSVFGGGPENVAEDMRSSVSVQYDEAERYHVRAEALGTTGAILTPLPGGRVRLQASVSTDVKLQIIPGFLIDLGLRKAPSKLIERMMSDYVQKELLGSLRFRDRYADASDWYYRYLRHLLRRELREQSYSARRNSDTRVLAAPSGASGAPTAGAASPYSNEVVRASFGAAGDQQVERNVIAGLNAVVGLRVRRGRDWDDGRQVTAVLPKEDGTVSPPRVSRLAPGTVVPEPPRQLPTNMNVTGAARYQPPGVAQPFSPGKFGVEDPEDSSYQPDASYGDCFYTGLITGVCERTKTARVEWVYDGFWGGTYSDIFDGYRVGKDGKYDLGVWFPGEFETDEDARRSA